jgi:hypothetical protein
VIFFVSHNPFPLLIAGLFVQLFTQGHWLPVFLVIQIKVLPPFVGEMELVSNMLHLQLLGRAFLVS